MKKFFLSIYIMLFSLFPISYAQGDSVSFAQTLEIVLKIFNILLAPLLRIAWWALSNDFVTWRLFLIDNAIWQLWNFMKNIAFYILGFMFIFSILAYLLWYNKADPKSLIWKMILATLWISFSWFAIWALLDISTVLTIWIWALPLKVINSKDVKVYKTISYLDLSDKVVWKQYKDIKSFVLYSVWFWAYLLPCIFSGDKVIENWDKYVDQTTQLISKKVNIKNLSISKNSCIAQTDQWLKLIVLNDSKNVVWQTDFYWEEVNLYQLISKIQDFSWPLFYMYGTLLNFYSLKDFIVGWWVWPGKLSIIFIVKLLISIILILPLLALAIVLVMRWFILWFIFIFSPLLVLWYVFKFFNFWSLQEKFSLTNVLALIFLPVTVTFALSIWIIFLSAINWMLSTSWGENFNVEKALGIKNVEKNKDGYCYTFGSDYKICIKNLSTPELGAKDWFSWILVSLLWAFVLWSAVMAALKTSSITASVVGTIESIWKWIVSTAPVIPTPWWMQSIWSLSQWLSSIQSVPQTIATTQFEKSPVNKFIDRLSSEFSWSVQKFKDNLEKVWQIKDLQKAVSQFNTTISNIPQGFSKKDLWSDIKKALMMLAKKDKNLRWKINWNDIKDISDIAKYPVLVAWLEKNGVKIEELFSWGKYDKDIMKKEYEEFLEKLKDQKWNFELVKKFGDDNKFYIKDIWDNVWAYIYEIKGKVQPLASKIYKLDSDENIKSFILELVDKLTDKEIEEIIKHIYKEKK